MATSPTSKVLQHLRRTVHLQDGTGRTDGELLECFIQHREDVAFAALVRRHGPMVWGVCRRLLNHHDAEDAFQAAFLVLCRKAASILPKEMVANWLYGVAHQTALQARRTAARRRARERQVTEMPEPAGAEQERWGDLQPLLDEVLSRLPDKYRVVIVLCDLEGKTRKEAAQQLGCPEGTVAGRLARARAMLAKRLARHGVVLSGGTLAGVLSHGAASACVPPSVVSSTIKAASLYAVGQAAAGVISVKVAALTEGVMKTMLLTKRKIATVVVLMIAALSGGAGLIYQTQAAGQAKPPEESKGERAKVRERKVDKHVEAVKKDLERLQGTWEILSFEIPTGKMDLPEDKKLRTLTIEGNKATLRVRKQEIVMTWLIDPSKKPKRLDICYEQRLVEGKIEEAGFDGKVGPAIYELEGDTLKECSDDPGEQRPAAFSTPRTTHRSLLILKRIKP